MALIGLWSESYSPRRGRFLSVFQDDYPSPGEPIVLAGPWQECNAGQVLDLDKQGNWAESKATPELGFICVGTNNFSAGTKTNDVHIVIGAQHPATGDFTPVFYDEDELGFGMSASYRPLEKVQWWFEHGNRAGTAITKNRGQVAAADFEKARSKSSTYDYAHGKWTITES